MFVTYKEKGGYICIVHGVKNCHSSGIQKTITEAVYIAFQNWTDRENQGPPVRKFTMRQIKKSFYEYFEYGGEKDFGDNGDNGETDSCWVSFSNELYKGE